MGTCCTNQNPLYPYTPLNTFKLNPILKKKQIKNLKNLNTNTIQFNKKKISQEYKIYPIPLGSGAFGEVRKAKHHSSKQLRAIKIISTQNLSDFEKKKILKEILILKKIDHPNIVKIYEFFEDEGFIYIVMELITGGELFDKIQIDDFFSEAKIREILRDLLRGVNYMHKESVVHRDLKLENVLFTEDGVLKIVDFGTSRVFFRDETMDVINGTSYYVAPEVLKGDYDFKCDIWSCGVIFFIMLSGFPPFNGRNDEEILENVIKGKYRMSHKKFINISKSAKDLIKKMLTYSPKSRPTAEECLKHPFFSLLLPPPLQKLPN